MQKAALIVVITLLLSALYHWQWKGRIPDDHLYIGIAASTGISAAIAFAFTSKKLTVPLPAAIILAVATTVFALIENGIDFGLLEPVVPYVHTLACAFWAVIGNHILVHYTQPVPTRR